MRYHLARARASVSFIKTSTFLVSRLNHVHRTRDRYSGLLFRDNGHVAEPSSLFMRSEGASSLQQSHRIWWLRHIMFYGRLSYYENPSDRRIIQDRACLWTLYFLTSTLRPHPGGPLEQESTPLKAASPIKHLETTSGDRHGNALIALEGIGSPDEHTSTRLDAQVGDLQGAYSNRQQQR